MKRFAILASLMMLAVGLPAATANHMSVGYMTTAGMEPEETEGNPSVGPEAYAEATRTDCYEADAEVSAEEATDAATAGEACGDLVYHAGNDPLERVSPPDQDLRGPIDTFDVQIGYSQPAGFVWGSCLPWCQAPAGPIAWEAFHTVGSAVGITDDPEEAREHHGPGNTQILTQDVTIPNAFATLNRETGAWEMDGWNGPPPAMERAIAFIHNEDGSPFTPQDLSDAVENNDLSSETKEVVCGMSADVSFSSTQAQTFCEIKFFFQETSTEEGLDTDFDGYGNKCNTPTYICAAQGPYWRSQNVGLAGAFGGQTTQTDVMRWHFVVAPNPVTDCPNVAPNHLDFDGDGSSLPYLAHDLDVYTTATDTSVGPSASIDGTTDYADALADDTPSVPALPVPVGEVIEGAEDAARSAADPVAKDRTVEPNNGDPVSGVPDNSRDVIVENRGDPTACQELVDSETADTRDPWVNLLDAEAGATQDVAIGDQSASVLGVGASVDLPEGYDAYGTTDESHDASNRPGPSLYSTFGKIGVFADTNDDGNYEQVPGTDNLLGGEGVWQAQDVQETGAYPMMWDMQVVGSPEDPENAGGGCAGPGGGFSSAMDDAGYGPQTGIAQAIYLREPTVFTDVNTEDPQTLPFPGGNNIYVLANNATRNLWDGDTSNELDNEVDPRVDDLVDDLRSHVVQNYGADASTLNVHQPGQMLGFDSDYFAQCGEDTGGFTSQISFTHACQGGMCEGDTIATMYTFEVQGTEAHPNTLGGGEVPVLTINDSVYEFGTGQHTWYDVDPFDNDPSRNAQQQSPPPTGD